MSSEDILAWWRAEAEVERTRRLFNGQPRLTWEDDDGWYFGCGGFKNDRLTWNVIGPYWSYDEALWHSELMRNVVIALHTLGQASGELLKVSRCSGDGYHPHHSEVEQ